MMKLVINLTAIIFFLGGIIHWLIIFGVMNERAPALLTYYFHSLAVLDLLVAFGLYRLKRWSLYLGLFITITQIPAHQYMMFLDYVRDYDSEIDFMTRSVDIILSLVYFYIFSKLIRSDFFNK